MNVKRKRDFDSQKRIGDVSFSLKDERTGTVRDVRDVTGILHKSMDLFLKPFDYLANVRLYQCSAKGGTTTHGYRPRFVTSYSSSRDRDRGKRKTPNRYLLLD